MYAVIDLETTGVPPGRRHRVVEVAVVHVDDRGSVVGEWCTLVNPERDLGPQRTHGIRAAEVRHAPTFDRIAGELARLLAGRVVVAHNLRFDGPFLRHEYERLGVSVPLEPELGLCTMHLAGRYLPGAGRSLADCCAAAGVELARAHHALHDARAAAGLLAHYLRCEDHRPPWRHLRPAVRRAPWPPLPRHPVRPVPRQPGTPEPERFPPGGVRLAPGDIVVFTGQLDEPRAVWEERAGAAGLRVGAYVTKATRLVVAADPDSLSTKARTARRYGVPIVTTAAFQHLTAAGR